ncbi:fucose isomerase [Tenericutes bacterium MZ-XQ]|nr:fucose isomerase [Tenericutes bacterium MZ-XQ]
MRKINVCYLPIGVGTFHLESAQKLFEASIELLKSVDDSIHCPDEMLLSLDLLKSFLDQHEPDLVIVQNITFANSAYMTEILKLTHADVLLWTLREPVIDGGRLRLNSLTGAFSAGYAFHQIRNQHIQYVFGMPSEDDVQKTIRDVYEVAKLKFELRQTNLLVIGDTPQGFGFGRANDVELMKTFGVNLMTIESRELTQKAKALALEEAKEASDEAHQKMVGLEQTLKKNKDDFVRLYQVYKDYILKNNIKAVASRCWPDFFTDYGTPVCGVLGLLNDQKIAAACEADAYGALSMYIGGQLSQEPTFLGDPVSLDEKDNTITFWHCGTAACSLARADLGATTGVHPNRKIGPTMEFGLKPSQEASLFRIGKNSDGSFRFFIAKAEILDKPQQFLGTSVVVKVKQPVKPMITQMVKEGWEPHFVVLYKDVVKKLEMLAEMLNIEIVQY